ncbi:hypothetical protein PQX77_017544 [Marasmius sp. AFHP31]|nr:hypothetical protein PQX77_017544 [Marasmius sp. AFHP31]
MTATRNRNDRFFVDIVFFQVEDEIYKVPKKPFTNNTHPPFSDLFSLPLPRDELNATIEPEGASEGNPIILEQVLKVDFERFLTVLLVNPPCVFSYPKLGHQLTIRNLLCIGTNRLQAQKLFDTLTKDDWLSILKLSTLWNFHAIRHLAIHYLSSAKKLSVIDRIVTAREYKVVKWFVHGVVHAALDMNKQIAHADAERIGLKTAISLYHMKGAAIEADWDEVESRLSTLFEKFFGDELRDLAYEGDLYKPGTTDTTDLRNLIKGIETGRKRFWKVNLGKSNQHYDSCVCKLVGDSVKEWQLSLTNLITRE